MAIKYLSVCSGIEAATVAWHGLGWSPEAFSEIEAFPSGVLAHHYPTVPNLGDMTKYQEWNLGTVDLLVGGTPCQSFSVAGLRKGLDDPRGNLALVYLGIADRFKPRWLVWENVPGVLSSNGGRDFGSFLGALGQLGYGFAYRVLDAQFFGVAQRRRRVFVVGHFGDWRPAAAVLFDRESLRRNPAPRRTAREDVANCLGASPASSSSPNVGNGQGTVIGTLTARFANNPMGIPEVDGGQYLPWPAEVACTLNAAFGEKQGLEDQHALGGASLFVPAVIGALTAKGSVEMGAPEVDANHYLPMTISSGQANASVTVNRAPALDCLHEAPIVAHAFDARQSNVIQYGNKTGPLDTDGHSVAVAFKTVATLDARREAGGFPGTDGACGGHVVPSAMQVRRLTPRECERLQGFPDDYTLIPWRKKRAEECPDGPRYKALGNSMAVPVMRWIGSRIALCN